MKTWMKRPQKRLILFIKTNIKSIISFYSIKNRLIEWMTFGSKLDENLIDMNMACDINSVSKFSFFLIIWSDRHSRNHKNCQNWSQSNPRLINKGYFNFIDEFGPRFPGWITVNDRFMKFLMLSFDNVTLNCVNENYVLTFSKLLE